MMRKYHRAHGDELKRGSRDRANGHGTDGFFPEDGECIGFGRREKVF
jgi:hypothetical protein